MKSRLIWAAVLLAAVAGFYYVTIRPTQTQSPGFSRKRPPLRHLVPPEIAPPTLPVPVFEPPALAPPALPTTLVLPALPANRPGRIPSRMEVPIQDHATIDFSTGAPHVIVQGKDQEALDKALKEMAEATKDITFTPAKK